MSRKTKIKNLKRGGQRNFTQKTKASVGGSTINPLHSDNYSSSPTSDTDKKRSEYTVILLENTGNLTTEKLKYEMVNKILHEMKKKNPNNEENYGGLSNADNDVNPFVKHKDDIKRNIENGVYIENIENIEETPNTRSRVTTFAFLSRTKTPSEKYLGITLDLTYLKKETGIEKVDIFRVCRESIQES